MLSSEENELLTRVGPRTPMGELIRRYWIPALLSEEVPEPDCTPLRIRLLGEDLVAFRDSKGRVGLLDERCSHRGTSLFYGRNEECGLRCIYHGWKYDVEGNVLETPAEPPDSNLRHKVHHTAYPCREASGMVFAYMGPKEKMPLFPDYEWLTLPPDNVSAMKFFVECNYLQCLEGDCDSSHTNFLHSSNYRDPVRLTDKAPSYDVIQKSWGAILAAIRKVDDATNYVRVSNFIAPISALVPSGRTINSRLDGGTAVCQVPSDDAHTWRFNIRFSRSAPRTKEEKDSDRLQAGPDYRKIANMHNNYMQDRPSQKTSTYTGIKGFVAQDACVTEGMGSVVDRNAEHLGVSDSCLITVRKFLLEAVREFQSGREPPGLIGSKVGNGLSHIRCEAVLLPADLSWRTLFENSKG